VAERSKAKKAANVNRMLLVRWGRSGDSTDRLWGLVATELSRDQTMELFFVPRNRWRSTKVLALFAGSNQTRGAFGQTGSMIERSTRDG